MKIILFLLLFTACSEKEFDPNDPKKSFGIAKEPYDDGNFERAVTRLGEFKSRFPYSLFATEAELLIADAYFQTDKFAESAAAYEQFVKLHPKHPKVDFAMYRIGDSYWQDAPDSIDRDQEFTQKAITEWKKLINKFPDSSHSKEAKVFVEKGRRRLAESVHFAAHFYCKREVYHACAYRYIKLLETFPEYNDLAQDSLKELVDALEEVAKAKEIDPTSDKNLFFKQMDAQQIRKKADTFRKLIKS